MKATLLIHSQHRCRAAAMFSTGVELLYTEAQVIGRTSGGTCRLYAYIARASRATCCRPTSGPTHCQPSSAHAAASRSWKHTQPATAPPGAYLSAKVMRNVGTVSNTGSQSNGNGVNAISHRGLCTQDQEPNITHRLTADASCRQCTRVNTACYWDSQHTIASTAAPFCQSSSSCCTLPFRPLSRLLLDSAGSVDSITLV